MPLMVKPQIVSKYPSIFMLFVTCLLLIFLNLTMTNNLLQLYTIDPINRYSLDPFVYTSYINNYVDLIERYGRTYYSSRLAFIYPARLTTWLFGSDVGYVVLRNALLVGMIGTLWKISIRFYNSKKIAFFISFLAILHPWFLRAFFWNYVDGIAIVYVLISMSYLLSKSRFNYFLSGIFCALAVNCHLYAAVVFTALIPTWLFLNRKNALDHLKKLPFFFLGLFGIYLALIGITYWEFPTMNPLFDLATLSISKQLLNGGGVQWVMSIDTLLSQGKYYLLYPSFILLIGLLFFVFRKRKQLHQPDLGIGAIAYLFLTLCACLIFHFVFKLCTFCFFYFSFVFPATFLLFIWLIGECMIALDSKNQNKLLFLWTVAYGCIWLFAPYSIQRYEGISGKIFAVAALTSILLIPILSLFNHFKLKSCLIAFTILLSPFVFYRDEVYASIHHSNRQDWDVYHGGLYLQEVISSTLDPKSGKVGFWYSNRIETKTINSVQAMYLWLYSRLCTDGPGVIGMPVIDEYFRKNISNHKYIALLGLTDNELDEGVKALSQEGIQTSKILRKTFISDQCNYSLLLLEQKI